MDINLPKLGEGAESGTVVSLLVKEGDRVEEGQTILELENEKAVAPIPATASGVVQSIRIKVGDQLSVGQLIMTVGEPGVAAAEPVAKAAQQPAADTSSASGEGAEAAGEDLAVPKPEVPAAGQAPPATQVAVAPPSIRRLARELGIDLDLLPGSGRGGRISMADLRAYIQRLQKLAVPAKAGKAPPPAAPALQSIDFSKWGPVTSQPLSPLRQTLSRRLVESWGMIPHVTQFDEVDITDLEQLRKTYAAAYQEHDVKLTLTAFALQAVVATLRRHPPFNASLDEARQAVVFKEYYHIGLAVDTDQGLLVPVLRDVDRKSLLELAREVNDLADKARTRRLTLEEMKGGTFTISNQGGIGGGSFTPIINRPEAAILGLGRGVMKPMLCNDQVLPRLLMPMSVSYDHRLIDGGAAARFMVDLVRAFQAFSEKDVAL